MLEESLKTGSSGLVSIIIPAYNAQRFLPMTLASARAQTYADLEIIVVDDGSTDATREIAEAVAQVDKRVRVVHQRNAGVAAARNRGIAEARGDYVILLNNDAVVTRGWVRDLIRPLQLDPRIGLVGPLTNDIGNEQKLSLLYGFPFTTDDEQAELWVAAASAAGVDVGRELMEKQVFRRVLPRLIDAIAAQAGKEVAEKIAGRIVPVLSSAVGATLNYYFLRVWGERAMMHFRNRHMRVRREREKIVEATPLSSLPPGP